MRIRIHHITALVDALWILQVAKILRSCKYTAMCTGQRAVKLQLIGGRPVAEFTDRICFYDVCLLGVLNPNILQDGTVSVCLSHSLQAY
jgi:hypothetical protein